MSLSDRLRKLEARHGGGHVYAVRYAEDFDGYNPPDLVRMCGTGEQMPVASFWRRYGARGRLIEVVYEELASTD
jgi:hypothetical protein